MDYLKTIVRDPRVPGALLRITLFSIAVNGLGAAAGLVRFVPNLIVSLVMGYVAFFLARDLAMRGRS